MFYQPKTTAPRLTKSCYFGFARLLLVILMLSFLLTGCSAPVATSPGAAATASSPAKASATTAQTPNTKNLLSSLPLAFEQNVGQTDAQVRFIARSNSGYQTFLTASSLVFTLKDSKDAPTPATPFAKLPPDQASSTYSVLKMQLLEANANPEVILKEQWSTPTNYFIGNDESQWRTAPNFSGVEYRQVYPGVDMQFAGEGQKLRYNFVLQPGSDVAQIRLQFEGAKQMAIGREGELVITTQSGGKLVHSAPVLYQEIEGQRSLVSGQFVLDEVGQTVSFKVGEYQVAYPLIIDPLVTYSTYLGGSYSDNSGEIAVDNSGNIYLTGETFSADFPALNPYQTYQAVLDIYISKLNPNLSGKTSLLYSTYLGGNSEDYGRGIAVDTSGNVYITGHTYSINFPTVNQYQTYQTKSDAFVSKLNPNLSGSASLLYSTYLDGNDYDYGIGIAVDLSGNVYITGTTASKNFPTVNSYQTFQGEGDAFVSKLNPNLRGTASLLYSTYLGASKVDYGTGVTVDSSGNVYVTGYTQSNNFPTVNQYQTFQGEGDAFVSKLNPNLSGTASLLYSTYLGGNSDDYGIGIAVDSSGNVYITGSTGSSNFPLVNPYQTFQGSIDAFVSKLNPNLSGTAALLYSTYLGASKVDYGTGITVDSSGNVYVTGYTQSNNFPTVNQYQTFQGEGDAFVSKLNWNLSGTVALLYSTYLGGSGDDTGTGIAVDLSGNVYIAGYSKSNNFPTVNQYQTYQGSVDAFVLKLTAINLTVINGNNQGSQLNTAFGQPLQVLVKDSANNPVAGVTVTFTAPSSGASATLASSSVTTDANGVASVTATANATPGGFTITASVPSETTTASFNLINTLTTPTALGTVKLLPATVRIAAAGFGSSTSPKLTAVGADPANPSSPSSVAIQVGGASGIPAEAKGIIGTLTNVGCSGGGNLRFWTGTTIPNAVNLNVPGAQPNLNLTASFTTPLDSSGIVNLGYGSAVGNSCGYAVDVNGYLSGPDPASDAVVLLPATVRVASAGFGGSTAPKLTAIGADPANPASSSSVAMQVSGVSGIPAEAKGIIGTLTNVDCNGGGNLRFWTGTTIPNAVNLNVPGAQPNLNLTASFTTPLDASGKVNLGYGSAAGNSCGYAVDVIGYVAAPTVSSANLTLLTATVRVQYAGFGGSTTPTLKAVGATPLVPASTSSTAITAGNTNTIPADAKGIIGTLTNVGCTGGGNLRFWTGASIPDAVNLNVPGAQPNLNLTASFITPLDLSGIVNLGYGSAAGNSCGYAVDVIGYLK